MLQSNAGFALRPEEAPLAKTPLPRSRSPQGAPAPSTDTRLRLLDAAERLFAERGIAATSLRSVTAAARANVAAVNYHFGSKAGLIEAVYARRIRPLNEERLRLLSAAEVEGGDAPPTVETVLGAFLTPVRELCARADGGGGAAFLRLMARANLEPSPEIHRLVYGQFVETGMRFHAALSRALPELRPDEIFVRFRFALGAMFFTYANVLDPEKLTLPQKLRSGKKDPHEDLVAFLAAGFASKPKGRPR